MFTGLIKEIGIIKSITEKGTNKTFIVQASIAQSLHVDESVSHNGVCLTVEAIQDDTYQVTAIEETLKKTTLEAATIGMPINLERAMLLSERLGGHIVQGHIDTKAVCILKDSKDGSTIFRFKISKEYAALIIEKGSIAINGVSLTIFDLSVDEFSVAIIPYTLSHTTMQFLEEGDSVNIEFDILGKYFLRREELNN